VYAIAKLIIEINIRIFEVRETPPTGNRSVDTSLVSASKDADKES
jgi:hypothetical protein